MHKQISHQILDLIKKSNHILLISHEKPDGDTLGSSLALAHFLNTRDKNHKHFCADSPAPYFNYLPLMEKIINDHTLIDLDNHDLIIALDCGDIKRTKLESGLLRSKEKLTIINIDHHYSNDNFGHYNLVIPTASSTSEIIYNFFAYNNINIDKYIATSLLTGIFTDTMGFTNAATGQDSFKIASILLNKGARIQQIVRQISQNKNMEALKFWGQILNRLEFNADYNFAYTIITQQDLKSNNLSAEEARDGLSNFLSNIQDVDFILVLTQEDNNIIKGSLRTTKDHIDVASFAKNVGGGGHKKAAGFAIPGQIVKTASGWQIT